MSIKIINILHHVPPYQQYENDFRPEVYWDTPNGKWVGIWGYDFPHQTGNEILACWNDIEYQVWQPDTRADRIYEHRYANGLVYKLFPAKYRTKSCRDVESHVLLNAVEENSAPGVIIHLNAIHPKICQKILKLHKQVPKVINFHSRLTSLPIQQIFQIRKKLYRNLANVPLHFNLLQNKKTIYTFNNSSNIELIKKHYNFYGIERVFIGINFNYWTSDSKSLAKSKFNISESTFVLSMASRFVPLKQIDKIISILTEIDREQNVDFKLLVAGNGLQEYTDYLQQVAAPLVQKNKVEFVGYQKEENLKVLYNASDVFISASLAEGGPVSVLKAISCGTPVLCTQVRGLDDYIDDANCLLPSKDYSIWKNRLYDLLRGHTLLQPQNVQKFKKMFDWDVVAKQYFNIYSRLAEL